jgi:hypothetical protein
MIVGSAVKSLLEIVGDRFHAVSHSEAIQVDVSPLLRSDSVVVGRRGYRRSGFRGWRGCGNASFSGPFYDTSTFRPEPSIKPQVVLMMALMRMTRPLQR